MYLCFDRDRKTIVANEQLSGHPFSPNVNRNRFKIAENLHKLFRDAKIIVGVRKQEDMVKSLYSQYVRGGGYEDYDSVKKYIQEYVNYDGYIKYLKSLFNEVFIKRLYKFIGEPVPPYQDKRYRVRLKPYQLKTVKVINRVLRNHPFASKVVREVINAVSNSRMQESVGYKGIKDCGIKINKNVKFVM